MRVNAIYDVLILYYIVNQPLYIIKLGMVIFCMLCMQLLRTSLHRMDLPLRYYEYGIGEEHGKGNTNWYIIEIQSFVITLNNMFSNPCLDRSLRVSGTLFPKGC